MGRPAARPHVPERTCIGCRRTTSPAGLVRITRTPSGSLAVGRGEPGRGAWLCAGSEACFESAVKRKALERALRCEVPGHELAWLRGRLLSEGVSTSEGPTGRKLEGVGGA
jgi:predicted RNA-binding protein YlxR (DUF448 family)